MTKRTKGRRMAAIVLVAVAAFGMGATDLSAKCDRRCSVACFVLRDGGRTWVATYTGDTNYIMAEWTSQGMTTLACRSRIIHIEVWEHAYSIKIDPKGGNDDVVVRGKVAYRLTGDFDGDGSRSTIALDGRISGDGVDQGDSVTTTFAGRGSSADGSKIKLRHRGTLDVRAQEWRVLEVTSGFFGPNTNTLG